MIESEKVPVFLLTGFLGSGKTSLLCRSLEEPSLRQTAVLINEFGDVGIDHHLVRQVHDQVQLLSKGCICCSMREDLRHWVVDLLAQRLGPSAKPIERIVIESSGVSEPAPILYTLENDYVLKGNARIASVILAIDAAARRDLSENLSQDTLRRIAVADRIVITKSDIADERVVLALKRKLADLNPIAHIMDSNEPDFEASVLLSDRAGASELARQPRDLGARGKFADHTSADNGLTSFTLRLDQPIDWSVFAVWLTMLLSRHGEDVLRVKGIVDAGHPDFVLGIHGVQHIVYPPEHLDRSRLDEQGTRIVFIMKGIARSRIEQSLRGFIAISDKVRKQPALLR